MPLVKAKCVAQAFDNQGKRLYYPGDLVEIQSDAPLAQMLTPMGKWVFDWPGREPPDQKYVESVLHPPPEPIAAADAKPSKKGEK